MIVTAVIAAFAVGYLFGSIPFGLVLTRLFGAGDLRSVGSGNIGATNVLRTGRKGLAAATLLLDALKGAAAIIVVVAIWAWLAPNPTTLEASGREAMAALGLYPASAAAIGALVGHCFPVWLRFAGGKGVATFLGTVLVLFPPGGLAFVIIWITTAYLTRYSSLAALVAVASLPLIALAMGGTFVAGVLTVMAAIVYYRHADNIRRLKGGTERRIGGAA